MTIERVPSEESLDNVPPHLVDVPVEESVEPVDAPGALDNRQTENPPRFWRRPGKALLGLGIFAALTGIILTTSHLLASMGGMAGHDMSDGTMSHGDMSTNAESESGMSHGGMSHDEMMQVDGAFNATPVTIETVEPRQFEASVRYTGSIHPYVEVTVYPRIAGQLTNYSVYPGDRVEAGQPLAQLDAAERLTEAAEARAEAQAMEATVQATQIALGEQEQAIERLQAELNYLNLKRDRFADLVKAGAISQDDYDVVDSEAIAKQADLAGARVQLTRMRAEASRDAAMASQAQAQAETASVLEGYTQIRAPLSGIVQERMIDPGIVVQPSMPILTIGDYERVRLQANVAQQDANQIQVGTPIVAQVPGSTVEPVRGEITSIFPQTDLMTRTVTVEAVVDNPEGQLRAGQFLEMEIFTARKSDALTVPQTAVVDFNGNPSVWVMNGDVAQRRQIQTGIANHDHIEIASGLEAGDQVITSGHSRLLENSRVMAVDRAGNQLNTLGASTAGNARVKLVSPDSQQSMGMGSAELVLEIQDPQTGEPVEVDNLDVSVSMMMKNMAPMTSMVEIEPEQVPGRFRVTTHFGMQGEWQVDATVNDSEYQGQNRFMFQVE